MPVLLLLERAERRHDLPGDGAARSVRADRGCGGPVSREEHPGVAPGRTVADPDTALLLAQLEGSEVAQLGAEAGRPDDRVRVLETAVGPAHAIRFDRTEHRK